jgi:hypothetical protein
LKHAAPVTSVTGAASILLYARGIDSRAWRLHAVFFLIRLAFFYCVIGAGILFLQLSSTPCERPIVLDDGVSSLRGPIEYQRLGYDSAYRSRVLKDVVFWGPRAVDFVFTGDISVKNFLFATDCKR